MGHGSISIDGNCDRRARRASIKMVDEKDGGRDHWPQVSCCLLAGGGMRTGQVIGSTNRLGEVPQDRPVHYQEVFATYYQSTWD